MRFDLPSRDRLRAAVIARRQRAWDAAREGDQPDAPELWLYALGFTTGALITGLIILALVKGWFAT